VWQVLNRKVDRAWSGPVRRPRSWTLVGQSGCLLHPRGGS
jgi:hypothetical protein